MTASVVAIAASAILIVTYALIVSERVNRAVAALLGGSLVILSGVLSQQQAIAAIDFNTLGLLVGMMIIVAITRKSGLFGYCAIKSAQLVKASPAGILAAMALVAGVVSAGLDNVTTVLLIAPVTFIICKELRVPVYPFLFAEVLASNIGGAATLVGDPPNIMIGSATDLTFNDFLWNAAPVAVVIMAMQILICHLIWGIKLRAAPEDRSRVMELNAGSAITDSYLLACSLWVIGATFVAFMAAEEFHIQTATVAMSGAAVLMLLDNLRHPVHLHGENVSKALTEVEWVTLFFFIGLFIVVGGVERAGLLEEGARRLAQATHGNVAATTGVVLWSSAVLSAILDNIPFVATMIPVVKGLAPALGGAEALRPVWWALSLGACLGGNGTLVGASANLAVAGIAERNGVPFSFVKFSLLAFPMMLASIAVAHLYLWWRFL
ncbi:MAG: ArsB/NhaD family transporter [Alphaproteobacteria bacterium]|nr:ArsB/NhaD family transporter [Alphaproteobacteria bacterium]MDE1985044.1 ArsB/NhaD family transporter [Alphaproteobacteria bacterium]